MAELSTKTRKFRMHLLTILGELLPVLGTVGLLGLWLYQQTGVERRSSELRKLATARGVFQTYQSNNALFNAMNELTDKNKTVSDRLRVFQLYNYELGLAAIEGALPESDKADIAPATRAYDDFVEVEAKIDQTQKRLETLQGRLTEREARIRQLTETAKKTYLWLYVGLSLVTIVGSVCKLVDKLSLAPK